MNNFFFFLLFLLVFNFVSNAQTQRKFGEIPQSDLEMKVYDKDKDASAVVLFEQGDAKMVVTHTIQLVFTYHARIKILKKSGLEFANIEIPMFSEDRISNLKASTFNINGKDTIETKVEKKSFYIQKFSDYYKILKFAFSGVREGSVIEYTYEKTTYNINFLEPWKFQRDIPVRESEFNFINSKMLDYKYFFKGDMKIITAENSDTKLSDFVYHWRFKNIPSFKEESYLSSPNEYILQVNFELANVYLAGYSKEISPSYASLSYRLLNYEPFGKELENGEFLKSRTASLIAKANSKLEIVKIIYDYVSKKILWNGYYSFFPSQSLRKTFRKERGNNADINFILIVMLRQAGLQVDPVVLSTRDNGKLNPFIAEVNRLNYVIAKLTVDSKTYLIDATDPKRPFDMLPFYCLNDSGRVINQNQSGWIPLKNNESHFRSSNILLNLNEDNQLEGFVQRIYQSYDALQFRKLIDTKSTEEYRTDLDWTYPNWHIDSIKIKDKDSIQGNISESFKVRISDGCQQANDLIIFNPFIMLSEIENPFKEKERQFPVDFGCPREERVRLFLKIPDNYKFLEIPKNVKVALPDNAGSFDYNIQFDNDKLTFSSRFKLNKTVFSNTEYELLKNFFDQIVKKQREVILIKHVQNSIINNQEN